MINRILGTVWVILGILWTAKPEILKNRLKKKIGRKIKWSVFGFVLVFGLSLIGSVMKAQGLLIKLVGLIGLALVVKAFFLASSKVSDKTLAWLEERNLLFFRIWGGFVLAMGLVLLFIK